MKVFASPDYPIRVSALGALLQCNGRIKALFDNWISDTAGPSAQTGTLLHSGVENWHTNKDAQLAIAAIRRDVPKNPFGDPEDAIKQFNAYILDPRNIEAKVILNEFRITSTIPCHGNDPTGIPIGITGRADQVRRDTDGLLRVYDIKTSGRPAGDISAEYCVSQLMYSYLMEQHLSEPVHGNVMILTRKYLNKGVRPEDKPMGVFITLPLTRGHYSAIINQIQLAVARIRKGEVSINPGAHCAWCGFQTPANCLLELGVRR